MSEVSEVEDQSATTVKPKRKGNPKPLLEYWRKQSGLAAEMTPEQLAEREAKKAERKLAHTMERDRRIAIVVRRARERQAATSEYDGVSILTDEIPVEAVQPPTPLYQKDGTLNLSVPEEIPERMLHAMSTPLNIRLGSPQFLSQADEQELRGSVNRFMMDVVRLNFALGQRLDFFDMRTAPISAVARSSVRDVMKVLDVAHEVILEAQERLEEILPKEEKVPRPSAERPVYTHSKKAAIKAIAKISNRAKAVERALKNSKGDFIRWTKFRSCLRAAVDAKLQDKKFSAVIRQSMTGSVKVGVTRKRACIASIRRNLDACPFKDWDASNPEAVQKAHELSAIILSETQLRLDALNDDPLARDAVNNLDNSWVDLHSAQKDSNPAGRKAEECPAVSVNEAEGQTT